MTNFEHWTLLCIGNLSSEPKYIKHITSQSQNLSMNNCYLFQKNQETISKNYPSHCLESEEKKGKGGGKGWGLNEELARKPW